MLHAIGIIFQGASVITGIIAVSYNFQVRKLLSAKEPLEIAKVFDFQMKRGNWMTTSWLLLNIAVIFFLGSGS